MHMRHPSNPDNIAATDKLAYKNVWKGRGWELVEKDEDGEWVAIGKKKKTKAATSSGSTVTETTKNDSNSEN